MQSEDASPAPITPNMVLFRGHESGMTPLRALSEREAANSPSLSPYLSNYMPQTPGSQKKPTEEADEEFLPSPSLSPYLTQAAGSPSSCSLSTPSPSSLPSTPQPLPAEHGVSASSSLVSPLLCLPSSEKKRYYCRDTSRGSTEMVDDEALEEQAKEAEACKRLVELVEIHHTIVRVVADSEEGAAFRV